MSSKSAPPLAERQHWAYAAPSEWRTPTGERADARQLLIPIGGDVSDVYVPPSARTTRTFDYTLRHNDPLREIMEDLDAERTETEPLRAILPAPDGLSAVLGSGAFTVTGTVAFSPVHPFNPAPTTEQYRGETSLIAQTDIDYQYPSHTR